MAPFVRIECTKCGTVFDVTKMVYDEGSQSLIYCPLCTVRFPRQQGKIIGTNFPQMLKE